MLSLSNLRQAMTDKAFTEIKFLHFTSRLNFTIVPIEDHKLKIIETVDHYNPEKKEFPTPEEVSREQNILYLTYGIKEFRDSRDFAEEFYDVNAYTVDTGSLINKIMDMSPSSTRKLESIILVLAFNSHELSVVKNCFSANHLGELSVYLSGRDNIVEAIEYCSILFDLVNDFSNKSVEWKVPINTVFEVFAKPILQDMKFPEIAWAHLPNFPSKS